jgi:REP element-mobilizing transposase RayT
VHATLRLTPEVGQLRTKQKLREMKAAFRAAHGEDEAQFRVVHFSIQNTHIHLIVEAGNRERLSRGITGLAVRLARRLNQGSVFFDRYHARPLRPQAACAACLGAAIEGASA